MRWREMYLDDYIQITFQSKPADIPCNVERKDRLCIQCTKSMIEDDYNVPLVCPKYRHLRQKLFKPYFCKWQLGVFF